MRGGKVFVQFLFFLSFILVLTGCNSYTETNEGDYNVIWISLDTLRADHLSCYGYYRNTSPNICNFAEDSLMYKDVLAQAPSTIPSHTSMFTS